MAKKKNSENTRILRNLFIAIVSANALYCVLTWVFPSRRSPFTFCSTFLVEALLATFLYKISLPTVVDKGGIATGDSRGSSGSSKAVYPGANLSSRGVITVAFDAVYAMVFIKYASMASSLAWAGILLVPGSIYYEFFSRRR
jgi:SRP-independent targeting protein 2/TMEM208